MELIVYAHHTSLTNALKARTNKYPNLEVWNFDFTSLFNSDFLHVKGQDNHMADALSRLEMNIIQRSTVNSKVSRDRKRIKNFKSYLQQKYFSLELKPLPSHIDSILVYCDTTMAMPLCFVSTNMRKLLFHNFYGLFFILVQKPDIHGQIYTKVYTNGLVIGMSMTRG